MTAAGKTITLIAAMARNGVIGLRGEMPWHLPGELQHFKAATMGKAIIMGRKTWQAIGRALLGRQNIVISRDRGYQAAGCDVVASLEAALAIAQGEEVMVIGGGELYRLALPLAQCLLLTRVDCAPAGDTWFPDWDADQWVLVGSRKVAADGKNDYAYEVQEWRRKPTH